MAANPVGRILGQSPGVGEMVAQLRIDELTVSVQRSSESHFASAEFWHNVIVQLDSVGFRFESLVRESELSNLTHWLESSLDEEQDSLSLELGDPILQIHSRLSGEVQGGVFLSVRVCFGGFLRERELLVNATKAGELGYESPRATHPEEIKQFVQALRELLRTPFEED